MTFAVECSVLGHSWEQIPTPVDALPVAGAALWLRCTRDGCHKERHDVINRHNGELEGRGYIDPPGWVRGEHRNPMADRRLELLAALQKARNGGTTAGSRVTPIRAS
jgi:hypothetical protein